MLNSDVFEVHARNHPHKMGHAVEVLDLRRVPRNAPGKVLKRILRDPDWTGTGRLI